MRAGSAADGTTRINGGCLQDMFGRFPATVPPVLVLMYPQAHHLDLEFYDAKFSTGVYLDTHRTHLARWHGMGA